METIGAGKTGTVRVRESLTFLNGTELFQRLESLHAAVFSNVPDLPAPSQIDSLLVTIKPDLSASAYVNELSPTASVQVSRAIQAGEIIHEGDVSNLVSYDLGVTVDPDCAIVLVLSHGWRKALFWDLLPLTPGAPSRDYEFSAVVLGIARTLIKGKIGARPAAAALREGIARLERLLATGCDRESEYQELLSQYPWFLGGAHSSIARHTNLDDRNIPDFTGVRARDDYHDVFEIKQPFLQCFKKDGGFTAEFFAAWDQAERYLSFSRNNRDYLRREKNLLFQNPHCFLLIGNALTEQERVRIREKESHNQAITVLTYDQVLRLGKSFLNLLEPTNLDR